MTSNRFYTAEWPNDYNRLGSLVCSLLNMSGGSIFVGMTDDENPVGVLPSDARISELNSFLRENISPVPCVMFSTQEIKGKLILVIEVAAGANGPYFFRGRVYLAEEGKIKYASSETVRSLVLRSDVATVRWEERLSTADIESDVDYDSVRMDFNRLFLLVPEAAKAKDISDMLACYGVFRDWRLTNAGDVLFGKNPDRRSPQVRIRAFCYKSDKSDDVFHDSKIMAGPLFSVLTEAEQFIARNTHAPQDFTNSLFVREAETAYPPAVIREALVNAVAHRDYSSVSGGVAIHIFPNRLEIWNSGDLPEGVKVDDLGRNQVSILRNPTMAYALHLRGYMEQAGRGSVLMCKQCEEIGLQRPEWRAMPGKGVTVVFHRVRSSCHADTMTEAVLDTIRRYPGINRGKLAKISGFSVSTVARAIRELRERSLVMRQGGPRYGGYFTTKKNSND